MHPQLPDLLLRHSLETYGRSALPDAPVQPYVERRSRFRALWNGASATTDRLRLSRRDRPVYAPATTSACSGTLGGCRG